MFLDKTSLPVQPLFGNKTSSLNLPFSWKLPVFQYKIYMMECGQKCLSVFSFNPVPYYLPGVSPQIITADFNVLFDQTLNWERFLNQGL